MDESDEEIENEKDDKPTDFSRDAILNLDSKRTSHPADVTQTSHFDWMSDFLSSNYKS